MVTSGQSTSNGIANFVPENPISLETEKLFEQIFQECNELKNEDERFISR